MKMPNIVHVRYDKIVNWKLALRCYRCLGKGKERFANRVCRGCNGTGINPEGWAYYTKGLDLKVGDIVELPPTPRTDGANCTGTVVFVGFVPESKATKSVIRLVERPDMSNTEVPK